MIEKYKPSKEDVNLFLNRISERIRLNNKNPFKSKQFEKRI
jgi:hypothetical protein